jgi:hypothetical protein
METIDEFRDRIRREQRLAARLRLATKRLEEAQRERIWAVVEAHESGLISDNYQDLDGPTQESQSTSRGVA